MGQMLPVVVAVLRKTAKVKIRLSVSVIWLMLELIQTTLSNLHTV